MLLYIGAGKQPDTSVDDVHSAVSKPYRITWRICIGNAEIVVAFVQVFIRGERLMFSL